MMMMIVMMMSGKETGGRGDHKKNRDDLDSSIVKMKRNT